MNKDIMATLNKHGVKERDPSKWKILETEEGEDPRITFQAGTYTNKRGMEIPVIFHCHKSGIIYRIWKQEMERRKRGATTDNIIELKEGEVYEVKDSPIGKAYDKYKETEYFKEQVEEVESKGKKLLELEDKKDLAGMQWRLDGLRSQLRTLAWCNHEANICTGHCKILEEIKDLERKCLRDP